MSELNTQIDQYILEHPRLLGEAGYYSKVADVFNVHPEKVRKRWRQLKSHGKVVEYATSGYVSTVKPNASYVIPSNYTYATSSDISYDSNGDATLTATTDEQVRTEEDLIRVCEIDTNRFKVEGLSVKAYNAWIKNKNDEIETKQLYSVHAKLRAKKIDESASIQKDYLLEELKKFSPYANISILDSPEKDPKKEVKYALEISIPDLHIGKLAWGKETGEDYDINIAVGRYKTAIKDLLSRVDWDVIEKIILPVGNDLIHVDTPALTTTGGTFVNSDSRFGKMFQTAKNLLIETIESLSLIAPVDVIIIPGNHDQIATFTLGEVLQAWFHSSDAVTVINTHTPRKYYQYGKNLIMYTHGHREKLNDLGIICATEQPELWAATKFRRVHVGHFHHSKQIKFADVQEFPGFTVKILNSLSATDAWHSEKGFLSLKAAEAFLYDKDKGLVGNFYHYSE